ncbi:TatD family hydrolase [candidate division WWE3 bacterium]|uniref:TatD family hydrolase n=1 Tax=candidate division WWE3 bacterium TaxID=2053526 RepID=A0A955LJR1_UNCKA|nr:TatD family hydrolase [candidate division WWE3 bacterium]
MIDTHSHVYFEDFNNDRDKVISRANEKLSAIVSIGVDEETSMQALELARNNEKFYAVVGFNPESVVEQLQSGKSVEDLRSMLGELVSENERVVGIGEIGLDYHWPEHSGPEQVVLQKEGFKAQVEFALDQDLPIVIHSRDAFDDTVAVLSDYCDNPKFKGVWHSFTPHQSQNFDVAKASAWQQLEQALELGLYIGINGIVTYPSAKELQDAVTKASLDRLLTETDAPFLAPQAYRGQRNEPAMVQYVVEKIALLKGVTVEEVDEATTNNAIELFGIRGISLNV